MAALKKIIDAPPVQRQGNRTDEGSLGEDGADRGVDATGISGAGPPAFLVKLSAFRLSPFQERD